MESVKIELSIQDAETIMKALVKMPYEQVAQLVLSMDKQIRPQIEIKK